MRFAGICQAIMVPRLLRPLQWYSTTGANRRTTSLLGPFFCPFLNARTVIPHPNPYKRCMFTAGPAHYPIQCTSLSADTSPQISLHGSLELGGRSVPLGSWLPQLHCRASLAQFLALQGGLTQRERCRVLALCWRVSARGESGREGSIYGNSEGI
jgi:hypothetical protein